MLLLYYGIKKAIINDMAKIQKIQQNHTFGWSFSDYEHV